MAHIPDGVVSAPILTLGALGTIVLLRYGLKNLDNDKSVNLKKPNDVYYEIYREARNKAKSARAAALEAYLDAKNIKATYMLEDIQDSDEEFNELFSN